MKKFGMITIALVLLAAGVILYNRSQENARKLPSDTEKGTLVKEQIEWKRFYM